MQEIVFILSNIILIILISIIFKKFNFLLDNPNIDDHKLIYTKDTPLAGGIFFYLIFLFLITNIGSSFLEFKTLFFALLLLILGIFSDIKKDFHPSKRLFLQVLIVVLAVIFLNVKITDTRIEIIDFLLTNFIFQSFFTIFCILTVLNGFNFLDGFNGIAPGYFLLSFLSLYILTLITKTNIDVLFLEAILAALIIFYIFNIFGKVFLGDNGIYLLSFLLCVLSINFLNNNAQISPIFAVNIFWYPAFENLFSIIRRYRANSKLMSPDRKHFHTLINIFIKKKLNKNLIKNNNSITGLVINTLLLPNFIFAILNYNKSLVLGFIVLINILVYLLVYWLLKDVSEDS